MSDEAELSTVATLAAAATLASTDSAVVAGGKGRHPQLPPHDETFMNPDAERDCMRLLGKSTLFQEADRTVLSMVCRNARRRLFHKGEILHRQGEKQNTALIVRAPKSTDNDPPEPAACLSLQNRVVPPPNPPFIFLLPALLVFRLWR